MVNFPCPSSLFPDMRLLTLSNKIALDGMKQDGITQEDFNTMVLVLKTIPIKERY